ncbi:hypothetical protein [Synechococcus sp. M16CYN]|uniref:hypothetical protein n=1 Tax=Synechococcus sp. M16CYN TaxID=3103139 RepID=UPI003250021A
MATIQDPLYVKLCAKLASKLSISLASARNQVDQAAAKEGKRDVQTRRALVQSMLDALDRSGNDRVANLNSLLKNSEGNGNFILED